MLMLLYLTGEDGYYYDSRLRGRNSWIGYDLGFLDQMESEKLLVQPQKGTRRRTYISLTKEGIRIVRSLLRITHLPGVDELVTVQGGKEG